MLRSVKRESKENKTGERGRGGDNHLAILVGMGFGALHEHLSVSALFVIVFIELVCPLLFR